MINWFSILQRLSLYILLHNTNGTLWSTVNIFKTNSGTLSTIRCNTTATAKANQRLGLFYRQKGKCESYTDRVTSIVWILNCPNTWGACFLASSLVSFKSCIESTQKLYQPPESEFINQSFCFEKYRYIWLVCYLHFQYPFSMRTNKEDKWYWGSNGVDSWITHKQQN